MDPFALSIFAFALIVNAGIPGPSVVALVSRVIAKGWRDVAPFLAAMWIGEVLWLTLAMAGLAALAETFHALFVVLKYAGVAYLIWLALRMWTQPLAEQGAQIPQAGSGWAMFGAGMALTLGNPKIMVFYLALLPTLLDVQAASLSMWAVLALITAVCLAVVDLSWVLAAHHARQFLRTPRARRMANRVGTVSLGGAAAVIASR